MNKFLKIAGFVFGVGLLLNFLIDCYLWANPEHGRLVLGGFSSGSTVKWDPANIDLLRVEGNVVDDDPKETLKGHSQQYFAFKVHKDYVSGQISCQFYNALQINNFLAIPEREDCEIISLNLPEHTAQIRYRKILITVSRDKALWQDPSSTGKLIGWYDRMK